MFSQPFSQSQEDWNELELQTSLTVISKKSIDKDDLTTGHYELRIKVSENNHSDLHNTSLESDSEEIFKRDLNYVTKQERIASRFKF